LLDGLSAALPGLHVNGSMAHRLPGNLNVTLPHASALAIMQANPDLCVSTGSACSSAEVAPSTVLAAMGVSPEAASRSLRVGLGRFTSAADVDFGIRALSTAV
jgi:cysteine desulfurase